MAPFESYHSIDYAYGSSHELGASPLTRHSFALEYHLPTAHLIPHDPWDRTVVKSDRQSSEDLIICHHGRRRASNPYCHDSNPIGTHPGGTWFLHEFYNAPNHSTQSMSFLFCGMLDSFRSTDYFHREPVYLDPVNGSYHAQDGTIRFVSGGLTAL